MALNLPSHEISTIASRVTAEQLAAALVLPFGTDGGGIESDGNGAMKVSLVSAPLASGAATAANQATEIADLVAILAKLPASPALDATLAALSAKFAALGQHTAATSLSVVPASDISTALVIASPSAAYRSNITAADLIPNPGTVTGSAVSGGSCTAGGYNLIVVAKNQYGRTLGSTKITVTTSGSNLTVRGAFAAVAGATFYDIYCDLTTDPRWVGEITETQRASGTVITLAGTATANCTTAAGGVAGAVDIQVPAGSTMPQSGTTAAQSTALLIPALNTAMDCTGKSQVRFNCTFSRSGDGASLAATVAPAFYDELDQTWYLGDPKNFAFGGTAGTYNSLKQALVFDVRGAKAHLVLLSISGTGARMDANAVTS